MTLSLIRNPAGLFFAILLAAGAFSGCQKKEEVSPPKPSLQCLENTCFETFVVREGTAFRLVGTGLRKFLWVDVYTAAFYLPEKSQPEFRRGTFEGPKMIVLEYHRKIEKTKIIQSIEEDIHRNPEVDPEKLKDRFGFLTAAFEAPEKAGSRYEFVYSPGKGMQLIYQGQTRVLIPGDDFADAFFGIWTSPFSKNPELRLSLLGYEQKGG